MIKTERFACERKRRFFFLRLILETESFALLHNSKRGEKGKKEINPTA